MNLPSGESLVRQIVHGQRYFEAQFGVRCTRGVDPRRVRLPGRRCRSSSRPAACDRFVTQKLSWNTQNRFPHHTFWWEGLDGTRVLTHFPPVDTYNAEITPAEVRLRRSATSREHGWSELVADAVRLRRRRRRADAGDARAGRGGWPTSTACRRSRSARRTSSSTHVEAEVAAGAPVPVWRGELYFETHRGTLTSQSRTKLGNRRCERLLREAELWCGDGRRRPRRASTSSWREVLIQQFHDILPGSSIAWVHADAEARPRPRRRRSRAAHRRAARRARARRAGRVANAGRRADRRRGGDRGRPTASTAGQRLPTAARRSRVTIPALGVAPLEAQPIDDRVVRHRLAR